MQPLSSNWWRVKRRLASQNDARIEAAARRRERIGLGELCEHSWSLVRVEDTVSGAVRLSSCSNCQAVLREWIADSSAHSVGPDGSVD